MDSGTKELVCALPPHLLQQTLNRRSHKKLTHSVAKTNEWTYNCETSLECYIATVFETGTPGDNNNIGIVSWAQEMSERS